jgi:4'-phosphopantetheinyl transferase EntD
MEPAVKERLEVGVAALFDVPVSVGITDPRAPQPPVLPEEAAALARATPARRREFAAGRAASRAALGAALPVPMAADRSPVWPAGWRGGISHSATLCLAVATRAPVCLGIDLEPDEPLDEDLVPSICSKKEMLRIDGPGRARRALAVFAAKEAVYKAQFPLTRTLFGFDHLDVTLHEGGTRFAARFLRPVDHFAPGDVVPGRFARLAGHLVAGVTIGQPAREGA